MLYVQDRMNHTLAVLENYYNDTHTLILESGVSTYNFTIPKNQDGSEYLVRGNYIVLADDKGQGWKFTIMATDETHSSLDVECEDLGLELLNKVRISWASPGSAQPFKFYFDKAVRDTGWTLGVNEISNLNRTLSWDGRDTALKRLLSICTQFDHAEIEFKVEFKNMQVTKQVVNVYKQRGANRSDVQLVYGDTVNDIRKTTEIRELATAIQGVGGVIQKDNPVEGEPEEHVDFSSLTYDDGEYFTPAGDPFLYARVANQQFNIKDTYLEDFYDYDTQDAQELLNRTLTQLKDRCQPKINYEVDLAKVDSSLNLGDTVTIIDHDYKPELLLSGRVLQLEKSYTNPVADKVTFGNYLIVYSSIPERLKQLQEQLKNIKIPNNFTWTRYAEDANGKGMTAAPNIRTTHVAFLSNQKTGVPSDDPADYAGHWVLIKGDKGDKGASGKDGVGIKSTVIAYQLSSSGTATPTGTWSATVPALVKGQYLWTRTTLTYTDNTSEPVYSVSYVAKDGNNGANGVAGKDGVGIKTTAITYATSKSGTSAPTSGWVSAPPSAAAGQFIWTRTIWTYTDKTTETGYSVGKIGEKGDKGDTGQGIPGKPGSDGRTPYLHTAWANSFDGKNGFSTDVSTNKSYMGTYFNFTKGDPTDPGLYNWIELVGALAIGGRNLYLNSKAIDDSYARNRVPTKVTVEPFDSTTNMWHIVAEQGTGSPNGIYLADYANGKIPDKSDWCYSVDVKGTGKVKTFGIESGSMNPIVGTIGSEWSRISQTGHVDNEQKTLVMYFDCNSSPLDVYIKLPKLETGNMPTDWSPAPEDAQNQIDTINKGLADTNTKIAAVTKMDSQATAPTNPKKGDQWWVKDANGNINAFKIWDGTKWADSIIQQSAMNIGTLNGNVINGATINGSEFTNNFDYTGPDKIHFQGVTQIKDGSVNITWKIPENNQTGETKLDASGLMSVIRDSSGTAFRRVRLQMGQLELSDLLSGTGSSAEFLTGTLDAQYSYRNSGVPIYLNGWASWNENFKVRITRNGRQVTISGYIKHNDSATISPMLQLPAWACPAQDEIVNATSFNASVVNNTACNLSLKVDGRLVNNAGTQKGGYLSFSASYTAANIK
ncbi:phage tail spike protein [Latilactobacillus curvatus]